MMSHPVFTMNFGGTHDGLSAQSDGIASSDSHTSTIIRPICRIFDPEIFRNCFAKSAFDIPSGFGFISPSVLS